MMGQSQRLILIAKALTAGAASFTSLGLVLGWAAPALGEEATSDETKPYWDEVAPPANWVAQIEASQVQITGVRVEPTETGLSVVLETAAGELSAPTTETARDALSVDIPNAVLALPEGESFEQFGPTEGIAFVSVTGLSGGGVRVSITGTDGPPDAQVSVADGNLVLSVMPGVATAAEDADEDTIQLVVTATRTEEDILDVPRSVTVITREEIEEQSQLTTNVQDILGLTVPGLGPPTQSFRNFPQTLRGREVQILVDGVPISTNQNTAFAQELRSIAPSAIEQIEVVRGSSAAFGEGATGGVINIITRQPEEELTQTIETRVNSRGDFADESFGTYVEYGVSETDDPFDVALNISWETFGYTFDAEGDRIPNFDNAQENGRTINLFGKFGVNFTDDQRLQVSVNHFDDRQEVEFISDPNVDNFLPGTQKAEALEVGDVEFIGANDPRRINTVINLNYTHENLLGSQIGLQAFYRENSGIIGVPFDFRPFGSPFLVRGSQESERWGGRLQLDTPISEALSLLWGADYSQENLSQPQQFFDLNEFDQSGGRIFRVIEDNFLTPPYEVENLGLFAQLSWDISDRLLLSGGSRYENIRVSADDYTFLGLGFDPDRNVEGGTVNADDVVFNIGAVYEITNELSVFGNFSQGFGVPDFGRLLRNPPDGFTSVENDLDFTEPQKVNNYELGFRGQWQTVQFSLAGFFNESDLGVSLVSQFPLNARVVRAPRRIYGVEATLDWQPSKTWQLGGLISWNEGEDDQDEDGDFEALSTFDIQPIKITAYVENETLPGWRNRLQSLYVGNRDRGFEAGVDPQSIEDYFVVDYISSIQAGPGEIQIGIQNLFDNQYFPLNSQLAGGFSNVSNRAAPGRTFSLGYRVTF